MERRRWAWEGWCWRAGGGEERRGGGPRESWLWRDGTDLECAVEMREDGGVGAGAGRAALVQQAMHAHLVGGSIGEGR